MSIFQNVLTIRRLDVAVEQIHQKQNNNCYLQPHVAWASLKVRFVINPSNTEALDQQVRFDIKPKNWDIK